VRVSFQVDADGLLSVSARETTSGVEASVAVKPSYGLSDEEIARMLSESMSAASADLKARALREQQVEAQRLIEAARAALARDGDLLDPGERTRIETLVERLGDAVSGDDGEALTRLLADLTHGTEEFAMRRMDRAIRSALTGARVDELLAGGAPPARE
jgi:molecular chaperone HscA